MKWVEDVVEEEHGTEIAELDAEEGTEAEERGAEESDTIGKEGKDGNDKETVEVGRDVEAKSTVDAEAAWLGKQAEVHGGIEEEDDDDLDEETEETAEEENEDGDAKGTDSSSFERMVSGRARAKGA